MQRIPTVTGNAMLRLLKCLAGLCLGYIRSFMPMSIRFLIAIKLYATDTQEDVLFKI